MSTGYHVAVVGATGAVGTKMIEMLEKTTLPIKKITLLASKRSAGKTLVFKNEPLVIQELTTDSFAGVDIALFSAGGGISKQFAPEAVKHGAVVIDNTSHFRMDPNVPLVVPEVNPHALAQHKGIIANPNCSTIQMMVALEPIRQKVGLSRVLVSTYQAVSGAGAQALAELTRESQELLAGKAADELNPEILPAGSDKKHYPIAFNALPQIDVFAEEDYTYEEWKMINETKKIMEDTQIKVTIPAVAAGNYAVKVAANGVNSNAYNNFTILTGDQVTVRF
ncbi:MAG: aspartate-semialdehyde dehydrogenase, partial [Enterococcus casseliflavus]